MHLGILLLVFAVIFVAELPDKSLFASLILSSRFPGWYVWLGAASAFLVHVVIAVTAGQLLTLLPHKAVEAVVALLFFGGAMLLFFGKHGIEEAPKTHMPAQHSFKKVFATTFGVVFIGEWGDITQIATANYVAKYHDPWSVGAGALLGLWSVTALAILVGTKALTLIPPKVLLRLTGTVLLGFAVWTLIGIVR